MIEFFFGDGTFVDFLQYVDVFVIGTISLMSLNRSKAAKKTADDVKEKVYARFLPELEKGNFIPFVDTDLSITNNKGGYTKDNNIVYFTVDFHWTHNNSNDPTPLFMSLPFFEKSETEFDVVIEKFTSRNNIWLQKRGGRYLFVDGDNMPILIKDIGVSGVVKLNGTYKTNT